MTDNNNKSYITGTPSSFPSPLQLCLHTSLLYPALSQLSILENATESWVTRHTREGSAVLSPAPLHSSLPFTPLLAPDRKEKQSLWVTASNHRWQQECKQREKHLNARKQLSGLTRGSFPGEPPTLSCRPSSEALLINTLLIGTPETRHFRSTGTYSIKPQHPLTFTSDVLDFLPFSY